MPARVTIVTFKEQSENLRDRQIFKVGVRPAKMTGFLR